MIPEQADEASNHIVNLIMEGASLSEVVTAVREITQGWPADAMAVFQYQLQDVADEIGMKLPAVEQIERDGFPVSISINGDSSTPNFRVPVEGAVARVQRIVAIYLAAVDALEAELPPRVQSLESLLMSDPFLGSDHGGSGREA